MDLLENDPEALTRMTIADYAKLGGMEGSEIIMWLVMRGADALWLETLSATGRADVRQFLEWRLHNGLSLAKAAEALGISRTSAYEQWAYARAWLHRQLSSDASSG